ncbi:MAG: hypothetical protein U5L07_17530 [Desulfobacterales bacterium]|nr:hypothetical protein [Desulfobacterales bacterium]
MKSEPSAFSIKDLKNSPDGTACGERGAVAESEWQTVLKMAGIFDPLA